MSGATDPSAVRIAVCPRRLRPAALRQLHDRLPPEQQAALAAALEQVDPADDESWSGLLVAGLSASEAGPLEGVVWVQRAIGNTAVLWAAPDGGAVPLALLRAAANLIDEQQLPLAQLVAGEHDGYDPAILATGGFPRFAGLHYLFAELPHDNAPIERRGALQFVPRAGEQPQRLGALLEQTYLGTLDCPGLDGVRPIEEVLAGYRAQGRHTPEDWFFVQESGVAVGALLLAAHPEQANYELVYMGVVPAARGRRFGEQIVEFALETAARRGAERLVLAVDEANAPARRMYERAGFVAWDCRIVYARLRSPAQPSAIVELPRR